MEFQKLENNWIIILSLLGLSLLMIYVVLPKLFKNYSTEKGLKLALFLGMMLYLSIDFYKQEKYGYIAFFAVGSIIFSYLTLIAKRK